MLFILVIFGVFIVAHLFVKLLLDNPIRNKKAEKEALLSKLPIEISKPIIATISSDFRSVASNQLSGASLLPHKTDYNLFIYSVFQCLSYEYSHPDFVDCIGMPLLADLFYAIFLQCDYFSIKRRPSVEDDIKTISDIYLDARHEISATITYMLHAPSDSIHLIVAKEYLRFMAVRNNSYGAYRIAANFKKTADEMHAIYSKEFGYSENSIYAEE